MVLNRAQSRLYVAVGNADSLVIIDTGTDTVVGGGNVSAPLGIFGGQGAGAIPKGSNPNSVSLSRDERTAFVTNGGTNDVAVVRLGPGRPRVLGLIPTGWQPNSVSVSPDGSTLYVVNGKSNPCANPLNCRFIKAEENIGVFMC